MLTKLNIKNFKRLKDTGDIPFNNNVVFIGQNNSGKTTALQALTLWQIGLNKWIEKRSSTQAKQRTGVQINRKDIFAIPIPNAKYLWTDLFVIENERDVSGQITGNKKLNIEITVEGMLNGKEWICGLEFEHRGEEVLYCRPLKDIHQNSIIKDLASLKNILIAYLPPMSGLKSEETKLIPSAINSRIGEGLTAEVLRNLCYLVLNPETDVKRKPVEDWNFIVSELKKLFLIEVLNPMINGKGDIALHYKDEKGNELDISSSGRGLQQVLLLLTYLITNPGSTLLLDEPDAHLEILKQQQVYNLIKEIAKKNDSQIISASHSEIVLRESVETDTVIAFHPGGKPHQINDRGTQLLKSLNAIGFDKFYLADIKKRVVYLEGSTDYEILKMFARKLNHPVLNDLENAFVDYVSGNLPQKARENFYGLKEAVPDLRGVAIFDKITNPLQQTELQEVMWNKNEIENYFFKPDALIKFAEGKEEKDLFGAYESERRKAIMQECINLIIPQIAIENPSDKYWSDQKASPEMERIFEEYYKKLGIPEYLSKNKFYEIIDYIPENEIDAEVKEKLDMIQNLLSGATNEII